MIRLLSSLRPNAAIEVDSLSKYVVEDIILTFEKILLKLDSHCEYRLLSRAGFVTISLETINPLDWPVNKIKFFC